MRRSLPENFTQATQTSRKMSCHAAKPEHTAPRMESVAEKETINNGLARAYYSPQWLNWSAQQ
jgi:hypothetical protein